MTRTTTSTAPPSSTTTYSPRPSSPHASTAAAATAAADGADNFSSRRATDQGDRAVRNTCSASNGPRPSLLRSYVSLQGRTSSLEGTGRKDGQISDGRRSDARTDERMNALFPLRSSLRWGWSRSVLSFPTDDHTAAASGAMMFHPCSSFLSQPSLTFTVRPSFAKAALWP